LRHPVCHEDLQRFSVLKYIAGLGNATLMENCQAAEKPISLKTKANSHPISLGIGLYGTTN